MKHWMPANGTEGLMFQEEWCDRCTKDERSDCHTLTASYFEVHLDEWRLGPDGPYCTGFERVTG